MKQLHSIVIGKGPPLMILHGFLGMSDNWKTMANHYVEKGFQVHLLDHRNHGKSFHSDIFNYETMTKDVLNYCEKKELENINIIGHSMGGKVAMLFATKNPDKVKNLIIVDISPKYYPPHHYNELKGLKALYDAHLTSREQADNLLKAYISDQEIRWFLLKNLYRKDPETLVLKVNVPAILNNYEAIGEALPKESIFENQTLFIKGEQSDYIGNADLIKTHFPKSKIISIEKSGHWVHAHNPKMFLEKTLDFLMSIFF